jgi:predicted transcriptional regulator
LRRTGIKTIRTLTKCLDRLTLFGLLARKQINNGTNHYVFEKNQMQEYIQHNLNKRRKITLAKIKQQQSYIQNNQQNVHILKKGK